MLIHVQESKKTKKAGECNKQKKCNLKKRERLKVKIVSSKNKYITIYMSIYIYIYLYNNI